MGIPVPYTIPKPPRSLKVCDLAERKGGGNKIV